MDNRARQKVVVVLYGATIRVGNGNQPRESHGELCFSGRNAAGAAKGRTCAQGGFDSRRLALHYKTRRTDTRLSLAIWFKSIAAPPNDQG